MSNALGAHKPLAGKTVCIDYSSVNIAKPFHIGHLMTTVIGGALYKIFKAVGANVVGINHLGDWGTQFGGLISAFKRWGSDERLSERGLDELLDLYVRYHNESEKDEALAAEAREWSKKIESGDAYAVGLFEKFKAITLEQAKKVYKRLNIEFDSYLGESFYVNKVADVEKRLNGKSLLATSEGAEVVALGDDMPPALVRRRPLLFGGATARRFISRAILRRRTIGMKTIISINVCTSLRAIRRCILNSFLKCSNLWASRGRATWCMSVTAWCPSRECRFPRGAAMFCI